MAPISSCVKLKKRLDSTFTSSPLFKKAMNERECQPSFIFNSLLKSTTFLQEFKSKTSPFNDTESPIQFGAFNTLAK